ncbi:MAG: DegT/DnrJ/EryC1/StrS family aminotransferase [Abditibacteriales bacterium]|nr:DegT/DnrJ/EryC1/StrS family aminotransferase [Abditibacteriales bacterium]MDW8367546.1 DegT/DnrJ/EryC1/StrS family aminotransferase [Abditibacteriales bacterium]
MKVPFLDLTRQYQQIKAELDAAVLKVLASGQFILGETVKQFEEAAAHYCGAQHAVGVASGTDALVLALRALGIGVGDEVITSPFTFFATAECVSQVGATPVFVDIEPDTFNLDPAAIESALTSRTKAVIPVHLFGHCADMERIHAIAEKHGLFVIEDAAQAWGATCNGKRAGGLGYAGCFSFFPTKNLACCGDGGLLTTNDDEIAQQVRLLRTHGQAQRYEHVMLGYNSRLDALQAAVLAVKLKYVDRWNERRRQHAQRYNELFAGTPVVPPAEKPYAKHVYHQYTIRVPHRDAVERSLKEAGIGCMVYYRVPLHLQPVYAHLGYPAGSLPVAEQACREVISLPIFPELTEEEVEYVAETVRTAVKG